MTLKTVNTYEFWHLDDIWHLFIKANVALGSGESIDRFQHRRIRSYRWRLLKLQSNVDSNHRIAFITAE